MSSSSSIFNKIMVKEPPRATFDLSYDLKLTLPMGKLIPIHVQECIPGDTFRHSTQSLLRCMPLVTPVMHNVNVYTHSFFVPNRILWKNWEDFITGGHDGHADPALPYIDTLEDAPNEGSLADYLGVPIKANGVTQLGESINALPFAAYERIWFDYYRDQNLQDLEPIELTNGSQTSPTIARIMELKNRSWQHDYFTSALPFAQKGDAVNIPIGGEGEVKYTPLGVADRLYDLDISQPNPNPLYAPDGLLTDGTGGIYGKDGMNVTPASLDVSKNHTATFQNGTSTINDLRTAYALSRWLEKNARSGSRYNENTWANFHVKIPDSRLQRAEYLGGSKSNMVISEVLQTSETTDTSNTPQGNMVGHGISVDSGKEYSYRCVEHGYIITIMSIMPKTAYQQGIPRHFLKKDRFDYYWPDFAHLGEQPVYQAEIYANYQTNTPNEVFGYLPRYSEYRYNESRVAGAMRTTLKNWHFGRIFSNKPALNEQFLKCVPRKDPFAVIDPDVHEIVAHVFHRITATRPIPKYGIPI